MIGARSGIPIGFALLVTALWCAPARADFDAVASASAQLRRAVTVQRSGAHHDQLRALRALGDPSMATFFRRVAAHEDPVIRINGILGLAEVDGAKRVDLDLLSGITDESNRLYALNLAIGFDLIAVEDMQRMLGWEDLQETPRLALLADLVRRREPVDVEQVRGLTGSQSAPVRTVACCLMYQLTGEREHFDAIESTWRALDEKTRLKELLWVVNDIGRYKLDALQPWIDSLLEPPVVDSGLEQVALASSLRMSAAHGAGLWQRRYAQAETAAARSRLALLLFAAAAEMEIGAEPFALMAGGDLLTDRISAAGVALADGANQVPALTAVLDLDHWRSAEIVLLAAPRLPQSVQVAVLRHAIDRMRVSTHRVEEREAIAIRAATMLMDVDPGVCAEILAGLPDDSRAQEAMLIGLLASEKSEGGSLARPIRRIGIGRADTLAMLVIARHCEELSADEMRDLGNIVTGHVQISDSLLVQAAWLYLRHAGRLDGALAELFGPESSTPAGGG